tara:strand:+ start:105 stop:557 length:453 start_codon:yes stop_codon:yes gene_type:complete
MNKDIFFMQKALDQANKAFDEGEVPIGAVITLDGEIVAEAHNTPISSNDPSCHAEVNVIRRAAKILNNYRLTNTCLYVTLEPCMMCCGLLIHSRVKNLIFSAPDPKSGAVISNGKLLNSDFINHHVKFSHGILEAEASELLKRFFKGKRL